MKVALCQINTTVGDLDGNRRAIVEAAAQAHAAGAQLAVFPELVVTGYPPEDLLVQSAFLAAHDRSLEQLSADLPPDLDVLVGCLARNEIGGHVGRPLFNAAALISDGLARIVARKTLLPTYDIFDEQRYFEPCANPGENVVEIGGRRFGITICEDVWNDESFFEERLYPVDPVVCLADADIDVLINISGSPWGRLPGADRVMKDRFRLDMLRAASRRHDLPIVLVNQVGGNVGALFDGGSVGIKSTGLSHDPEHFEESIRVIDLDADWTVEPREHDRCELVHAALTQGIRDYGHKFGFAKAVVGLSGGIDSAVTAVLAVDALGADQVTGIAMPSHFSSDHSVRDARELADNLGIAFHELPIRSLQDAWHATLATAFEGTDPGVAEENVQSRTRGTLLMAWSNKFGGMLLTTGNKSECAVGYCTLYGDTNGALAPIADLWKTEVYALARWLNRDGERIPSSSIDKPPSAELRPGQLDSDSLPDYDDLDPVLQRIVEEEQPIGVVAAETGMDRARVAELYRMVQANEFKRYQYAPVLRVSERCWGGRRMPVSHRFRGE